MTTEIQSLFNERASSHGHPDMLPHMHQLKRLASVCGHATEFGVRTGQSTIALVAGLDEGGGTKLVSYDINNPDVQVPASGVAWEFRRADTAKMDDIDPTDLLFIDTLHNAAQVEAELKHAPRVKRYIAFHDVYQNGTHGEAGGEGIIKAILQFLADNPEWRVFQYHQSPWGLLVLERA